MIEACPKCGCVVDYTCMCPDGRPTFPLVMWRKPKIVEVPTYQATIFIAGDVEKATIACHNYCDYIGECVTIDATDYIYTKGDEAGVRIGFINYGRFPRSNDVIFGRAIDLAQRLIVILSQDSASVVATDRSVWLSCRES